MVKVYSTKSFYNLPTAHCQWFDKEPDGSPGDCAALHGYDRSVHLTFAGEPDEQGWIFPFGDLKEVKEFLEYYFDHTSVFPANDPRLDSIPTEMLEPGGILSTIRVLPYGVSMEMSSLFIWEHVNPFIMDKTKGRVWLTRVEVKEHEKNSGFIIASQEDCINNYNDNLFEITLPKTALWDYVAPKDMLNAINNHPE